MNYQIDCISNPFKDHNFNLDWSSESAFHFHQSLPGYKPTPLLQLKNFSKSIGINQCLVKDESHRLNLNAFKVLGASYAMAMEIAKYLKLDLNNLTYEIIKKHSDQIKNLTFTTATDGNHGRAVAWSAKQFGCKAMIYMPKGTSKIRLDAVLENNALAEITDFNYDETVTLSEDKALENSWILLQDSSWKGYEEVPQNIMVGYSTMVTELMDQYSDWPTHVIVQAGVGSFAAAILINMFNQSKPKPKLIILEPKGAACFYNSIKIGDGNPHLTEELNTIMAGLSCGMPSLLAWNIIKELSDYFAICNDNVAFKGMQICAQPIEGDQKIVSGESGAVPIGFLHTVCSNSDYGHIKKDLDLNESSNVLFFSTEGNTDPDLYRRVLNLE